MSDSDFAESIRNALDDCNATLVDSLVAAIKKYVEESKLFDANDLLKMVNASNLVNRILRDHIERWVANEIGNRLRCGIYDGRKVDELFSTLWTEQLEKSVQDRIRSRVNVAIDAAITERMKQIKT